MNEKQTSFYWFGRMAGQFWLLSQQIDKLSTYTNQATAEFVLAKTILLDVVDSLRKHLCQRIYHLFHSDRLARWVSYHIPAWLLWELA